MKKDTRDFPPPPENGAAKKGFSRRNFLKGAGLTTASTVLVNSGLMAGTSTFGFENKGETLGPEATLLTLHINGHARTFSAEPRATLAEVLREHLQLTGTKVVCDRGACSACTVWLDGQPVNSCMTLAVDVGDRKVTTIEGLSENGELHPLQQAFIDHDASQCGFCTPGMVMTAAHLLKTNPDPTLDEVKHAVRGNLCRCGTHPHVFKATLDAARKLR